MNGVPTPPPSSAAALARMRRQSRRDTVPEMRLRRELHRRGHRYRVDHGVLEGVRRRHDIVFTKRRVVVEVRGCFWHGCREHRPPPKANQAWWVAKLERNVRRDAKTQDLLESAGWRLVVVWEHDDVTKAADRVEAALREQPSVPR